MQHESKKRRLSDTEVKTEAKRTKLLDLFEELVRGGDDADELLLSLEGIRSDLRSEEEDESQCVEEKPRTCWGCRENQPNQAAHIDFGGCLYIDPFESDVEN